jgi:phosphoribosylglycinamide formyltransferase-1
MAPSFSAFRALWRNLELQANHSVRTRMSSNDPRARVTALCCALPGAAREDQGDHTIYRVRGKVFAYFLDNHHGDGIVSVCVKSERGENLDRARLEPERFYLPAYIGPRGWFGMRLDRGRVRWREVEEIVERSYRLTAPKALLKTLDGA